MALENEAVISKIMQMFIDSSVRATAEGLQEAVDCSKKDLLERGLNFMAACHIKIASRLVVRLMAFKTEIVLLAILHDILFQSVAWPTANSRMKLEDVSRCLRSAGPMLATCFALRQRSKSLGWVNSNLNDLRESVKQRCRHLSIAVLSSLICRTRRFSKACD